MKPQTRFAPVHNIFTGEEVIRFVPIPEVHSKRKGTTQHDTRFDKLLDFEQALLVPEYEFQSVRKALHRYIENKQIKDKVSVRQNKDARTKSYTLWLVNEPPQTRKEQS